MTKPEKIREGIAKRLWNLVNNEESLTWEEIGESLRNYWRDVADSQIISYLKSQGYALEEQ